MKGEKWKTIEEFPLYEVSNFGRVANKNTDVIIQPSTTMQGGVKVGLYLDKKQYTRSLKVLVAEAFVDRPHEMFDTPMLLDGNQLNCSADNIVWRPRWFAWNYRRQFVYIPEIYTIGPVVELDEEGIILTAYTDVVEVGVLNGLLFTDVWRVIHTRQPIFPTRQFFAFANKV